MSEEEIQSLKAQEFVWDLTLLLLGAAIGGALTMIYLSQFI